MMCWGTGRERTEAEYADLFAPPLDGAKQPPTIRPGASTALLPG